MKLDREQELRTRLSLVHTVSLAEAMEILDSSESTTRRTFSKLEKEGFAIRTHGGIRLVNSGLMLYSFETGARTNIESKTAIAKEACRLLKDGDVIFCDSGTTIQCFCAELVKYIQETGLNVQVYTNSLANLEILAPYMSVTLIGGGYRANRKDFCGYLAEQSLSGIFFSQCFVGADGCSHSDLFTTTDFETARLNEMAMKNSNRTVMLVDSSKFDIYSHVVYAPASKLYAVITDDGVEQETVSTLRSAGCRVIVCKADKAPVSAANREQE